MAHLLVYGTSIFLAGITAQLASLPDVKVLPCQTLSDAGSLSAVEAVLIDLNDPASGDALQLLRARPDLRLIGLNATAGSLTVMSGEVYFTPTLDEIIARLRGQAA